MSNRSPALATTGPTVLVAAWLVVSPFVLDYGPEDPTLGNVIVGGAIGAVALARLVVLDAHGWLSWTNVVLGAQVCVWGLLLDDSAVAAWNEALAGATVFGLSLLGAVGPRRRGRPRGPVSQRRQRPTTWR